MVFGVKKEANVNHYGVVVIYEYFIVIKYLVIRKCMILKQ